MCNPHTDFARYQAGFERRLDDIEGDVLNMIKEIEQSKDICEYTRAGFGEALTEMLRDSSVFRCYTINWKLTHTRLWVDEDTLYQRIITDERKRMIEKARAFGIQMSVVD